MNTGHIRKSLEDHNYLNSPLCSACMSSDRTLHPLGVNTSIFIKLFDNNYLPESIISLCWECTAVLNKVRIFKNKVDHAQKVLSTHSQSEKNIPLSPLSRLGPTPPHVISIKGNKTKADATIKHEVNIDYVKVENQPESSSSFIGDRLQNDSYIEEMVFNTREDSDIFKKERPTYDSQNLPLDVENNEGNNSYEIEIKLEHGKLKTDFESDTSMSDDDDVKNPRSRDQNYPDTDTKKKHSTSGSLKRKNHTEKENLNQKRGIKKKKKLYDYTLVHSMPDCKTSEHGNERITEYSKIVKVVPSEITERMQQDRSSAFFANLKPDSKCEKCVCFINGHNIEGHMKQFHSKTKQRNLTCAFCECTFSTKRGIGIHWKKHARIRQCLLCEFNCYSPDRMRHHLRDHRRQYQCNQCNTLFSSIQEFIDHYKKTHTEFICDYCGEKFNTKAKVSTHIFRRHSPIICRLCRKPFKSAYLYQFHYKKMHVEDRTESAFCVSCGKQFLNPLAFKYHVKYSKAHAAENTKLQKERVQCTECPKTYKNRSNMMDHYHSVHKGQPRFLCLYCGKRCLNKGRLSEHTRRNHLGLMPEKNKLCPYCGRGFSTNRILSNHIRTHTGERPHECDHCDARFAQPVALKSHLKTHSNRHS